MSFNYPDFSSRILDNLELPELVNTPADNQASEFFRHIAQEILDFESSLDQTQEVGVRLVTFGQAVTFHVTSLSYSNPSLIKFSGTLDDGSSQVTLVQHVSQISFLLMAMKRKNPDEPKKPIGFITE